MFIKNYLTLHIKITCIYTFQSQVFRIAWLLRQLELLSYVCDVHLGLTYGISQSVEVVIDRVLLMVRLMR